MNNHILIDKIITSIQVATDKKAIRFLLADGSDVVALAEGECCSSTWIEHISLPAGGFPAVVLGVDDIDMPNLKDGECIEYYGFTAETKYYGFEVKTDKGNISIDYRNESNGYYGGSLVWPGEYYSGGVFDQNESNEEWENVERDM